MGRVPIGAVHPVTTGLQRARDGEGLPAGRHGGDREAAGHACDVAGGARPGPTIRDWRLGAAGYSPMKRAAGVR